VEIGIPIEAGTANGQSVIRRIPFTIGVLSDLSNGKHERRFRRRRFREVSASTFDEYLGDRNLKIDVRISLPASETTSVINLEINHIVDFEPETIARRIPEVAEFIRYKQSFYSLLILIEGDYNFEDVINEFMLHPDLRQQFRNNGACALGNLPCWVQATSRQSYEKRDIINSQLRDFISYERYFPTHIIREPVNLLRSMIENVEGHVYAVLNQIMSDPEFRRSEERWRSLYFLLEETKNFPDVRVKVLDCAKSDLVRELDGTGFEKTELFRHIYDDGFGRFGGDPFGILIGDYMFEHSGIDIEILRGMSQICGATQSVFVTSASPAMFELESLFELQNVHNLTSIFQKQEYNEWNMLRDHLCADRIVIVVPRFLLRVAYQNVPFSTDSLVFSERTKTDPGQGALWANPGFAVAVVAARSFQRSGWFEHMKAIDVSTSAEATNQIARASGNVPGVEAILGDKRVAELCKLGFTSLCPLGVPGVLGFPAFVTCHRDAGHRSSRPVVREEISARLEELLAFGRLIHNVKAFCQATIDGGLGVLAARDKIQDWLATIDLSEVSIDNCLEVSIRRADGNNTWCVAEISTPNGNPRLVATFNLPAV
jgi:type VI secretion system protein ImpC